MSHHDIWIVDFGSQYTQLITRKTREVGYSSVIITPEDSIERANKGEKPLALVLSGGPQSVFEDQVDYSPLFDLKIPTLGICYGMQIIGQYFGGKVEKGLIGEYGRADIHYTDDFKMNGVPSEFKVWMSHSDHLAVVPSGFKTVLKSKNNLIAGIISESEPIMAIQFHPEVHHSDYGSEVLEYFFNDFSKIEKNWSDKSMLENCIEEISQVKGQKVLCAFSGGVDSLVAATVCHNIIGDDLHCFFVDNGLLRPQDYDHIKLLQKETPLNIEILDCKDLFLDKLEGVSDPEKKRKIIGTTFIDAFEKQVHDYEKNHGIKFEHLLQGTLYPDVIESISPHKKDGKSVTIKSHHNVGGLPERMHLKLLEPLKFLFKDEVRKMGEAINLKYEWVHRHPFPGPGIGVRILGEVKRTSVIKVQKSDQILYEELMSQGVYASTWQAFTVLLPVKTVGVKGDGRAYEEVICLRMVDSVDGMTASFTRLSWDFMAKVSSRITNEVSGITRVVYDITSKPPGTIEWE
jgi:GMP synthase (glutamine-hydrolysing)